jgi:5-methylcytosine-specific restriction enzyme A
LDFFLELSEEDERRERNRARQLRASSWWKNRLASGICHYCGARVEPKELTLDHVVPISRGGKSTRGNCVPACKDCNNKKKNLLPMEWQEYLNSLAQGFTKDEA